jgi:regulator of sirC expression with transglutaminase-like and TPR domain
LFEPATPRATLVRMLTNLKAVWASKGEHTRAFVAIDRIVTLVPASARMLRERAGVALRLGIHELARDDLTRVLELEPQAPDAAMIAKRLDELKKAHKSAPN